MQVFTHYHRVHRLYTLSYGFRSWTKGITRDLITEHKSSEKMSDSGSKCGPYWAWIWGQLSCIYVGIGRTHWGTALQSHRSSLRRRDKRRRSSRWRALRHTNHNWYQTGSSQYSLQHGRSQPLLGVTVWLQFNVICPVSQQLLYIPYFCDQMPPLFSSRPQIIATPPEGGNKIKVALV